MIEKFFKGGYVIFVITMIITSLLFGCSNAKKQQLILATTTSVYDSGLLDHLLPEFEKQNNCKVKVIAVGSGEAIAMGAKGDADALLVHSPKDEKTFMKEKNGIKRNVFMYNYYQIVGPPSDTAKINGIKDLRKALNKLAEGQGSFISRGDESGTHKKELKLWEKIGIKPKKYIESGQGMGETLSMASEMEAYTLTDIATFKTMKNKLDLKIYFDDGEELLNQYSIITINFKKFKKINKNMADKFYTWVTSIETKKKIENFKGGGLFFPY